MKFKTKFRGFHFHVITYIYKPLTMRGCVMINDAWFIIPTQCLGKSHEGSLFNRLFSLCLAAMTGLYNPLQTSYCTTNQYPIMCYFLQTLKSPTGAMTLPFKAASLLKHVLTNIEMEQTKAHT